MLLLPASAALARKCSNIAWCAIESTFEQTQAVIGAFGDSKQLSHNVKGGYLGERRQLCKW